MSWGKSESCTLHPTFVKLGQECWANCVNLWDEHFEVGRRLLTRWRPSLLGWRPSLLGTRTLLVTSTICLDQMWTKVDGLSRVCQCDSGTDVSKFKLQNEFRQGASTTFRLLLERILRQGAQRPHGGVLEQRLLSADQLQVGELHPCTLEAFGTIRKVKFT